MDDSRRGHLVGGNRDEGTEGMDVYPEECLLQSYLQQPHRGEEHQHWIDRASPPSSSIVCYN